VSPRDARDPGRRMQPAKSLGDPMGSVSVLHPVLDVLPQVANVTPDANRTRTSASGVPSVNRRLGNLEIGGQVFNRKHWSAIVGNAWCTHTGNPRKPLTGLISTHDIPAQCDGGFPRKGLFPPTSPARGVGGFGFRQGTVYPEAQAGFTDPGELFSAWVPLPSLSTVSLAGANSGVLLCKLHPARGG
jgi:hypothetical protein